MRDWTKGGIWNRATIYRYGNNQFCHLCFYKDKILDWDETTDTDWEFEVTEVLDNPDMLCILYPFVDKASHLDQLNGWLDNSDNAVQAQAAYSIGFGDSVMVRFD